MAYSGTVVNSYHGTAGTAVDTVNLTGNGSVRIWNQGAVDIWFTLGKKGATAATPVAKGNDSHLQAALSVSEYAVQDQVTQVKLLTASSTAEYQVELF